MPTELAPGVRVVASARMTAHLDAAGWADRLGWQRHAALVLGPLDQAGIIEAMMGQPALSQHRDEPALDDLAGRSTACLRTVIRWSSVSACRRSRNGYAARGCCPIRATSHAHRVGGHRRPPYTGRAGFIAGWREQQERSGRSEDLLEDAERVLNVLAVAEGPLSRAELRTLVALLGRSMDGVRIGRVIEQLERLVLPGGSPAASSSPTRLSATSCAPSSNATRTWRPTGGSSQAGAPTCWAGSGPGNRDGRDARLPGAPSGTAPQRRG